MKNGFFDEINRVLDQYLTPAVKKIFVINVLVTLSIIILGILTHGLYYEFVVGLGGLNPYGLMYGISYRILPHGLGPIALPFTLVECFTYMFIHAQVMHLLFNMLAFWFFAPDLENRWGTRRFWRFYLTVGAGAGFLHLIISFFTGFEPGPLIGASGAIYGILLAFAAYNPEAVIFVYGVLPIKAKYYAVLMGLLVFMGTAAGRESQVSNLTHLLGLIIAYVYLAQYHREWDIRRWQWR